VVSRVRWRAGRTIRNCGPLGRSRCSALRLPMQPLRIACNRSRDLHRLNPVPRFIPAGAPVNRGLSESEDLFFSIHSAPLLRRCPIGRSAFRQERAVGAAPSKVRCGFGCGSRFAGRGPTWRANFHEWIFRRLPAARYRLPRSDSAASTDRCIRRHPVFSHRPRA